MACRWAWKRPPNAAAQSICACTDPLGARPTLSCRGIDLVLGWWVGTTGTITRTRESDFDSGGLILSALRVRARRRGSACSTHEGNKRMYRIWYWATIDRESDGRFIASIPDLGDLAAYSDSDK